MSCTCNAHDCAGLGICIVFVGSTVPILCSCVRDASYGSNGKFNNCVLMYNLHINFRHCNLESMFVCTYYVMVISEHCLACNHHLGCPLY